MPRLARVDIGGEIYHVTNRDCPPISLTLQEWGAIFIWNPPIKMIREYTDEFSCSRNLTKGFLIFPVLVIIGILALAGGAVAVFVEQSRDKVVTERTTKQQDEIATSTEGNKPEERLSTEKKDEALFDGPSSAPEEKKDESKGIIQSLLPFLPSVNTTPETKEEAGGDGGPETSSLFQKFSLKDEWSEAVVDLLCTENKENLIAGAGSGVLIDPRGVILTNAHVAVDFLFGDYDDKNAMYSCTVRVGSPVKPRYRAQVLYMPRGYVETATAHLFDEDDSDFPYGVKDYALLYINRSSSVVDATENLSEVHPFLSLYSGPMPTLGSFLYLIGYPSRFLSPQIILWGKFYRTASPVNVLSTKSFTGSKEVDTVAFPGSIAGQYGASGGAVIKSGGELVAVPTFYEGDPGETTDETNLNAVTIDYINRDLKTETGFTLKEFIARDVASLTDQFMTDHAHEYRCMYIKALREGNNGTLPFVYKESCQ